jgi:basic membrane lipoprotein Med (substrate-binding protein (PBP1-ABC) superfamily)/DNA-binding SARP family transcriptional activator
VDFRILGPLEVIEQGRPIDLTSLKQRTVLAILLIASPRVVSTDRLLEDLWGEDAFGKENTLWTYISRLRSILDPDRQKSGEDAILVTKDHGYALDVPPRDIDAKRFERMAGEGAALVKDDPPRASQILTKALSMWRGPALDEFTYQDFARPEIVRLEELRLTALEDRFEADLRLGKSRELVGEIEALVEQHPLREQFVAHHLLALYRSGRQADALRAFERFRTRLSETLGVQPSPRLLRLEEQVLLHDRRIQGSPSTATSLNGTDRVAANPYKGLRAFGERDVADFFGRDLVVSDVLRRLHQGARLIGLVGPSGSGKSSILKAGLLPVLRREASTQSDQWLVAEMVPGAHPFAELEAALLRASPDPPATLREQFSNETNGMLSAILRLLPQPSSRLILAIDQFEELFSLVDDAEVRSRFLADLIPVLDDPHQRTVVILTLRSDYYGRPLEYPDFGARLGNGVVNVTSMRPDELECAALMPATKAGVSIESSLLVSLLGDVVGQPGALPLFQYTLTELFEHRTDDTLTAAAYSEMGGVGGALTRRAEDLYSGATNKQRRMVEQLFLRLVTITGNEELTLRRVRAAEMIELDLDLVDLQSVIERYADNRLLTLDRDQVSGAPTVEIAHEALSTEWDRLRGWIADARDDLQLRNTLRTNITEWEREGSHPGYLLSGARLERFESWTASTAIGLTESERGFVDLSVEARDAQVEADAERRRHELSVLRRASLRVWAVATAAVAGVVAVAFVMFGVSAPASPKIGVIYLGAGDQGQNDLLMLGVDEAERRYDVEASVITPLADPLEDLTRLCDSDHKLVLVVSSFFLPLADAGPECADTVIVGIDWPPPDAIPEVDQPNVVQAVFEVEEGSFIAGAAAALASQTERVGFVGAMPIVPVEHARAAFTAGVASVDPGVTVESIYVGQTETSGFFNPQRGKAAAEQAIEAGADVIFNYSVGSGSGLLEAVREASQSTGLKHWFIGSEADDYLAASEIDRTYVLTSVVKRTDKVLLDVVADYLDGSLEPGPRFYGIANDSIELSKRGGFLDGYEDRLSALEDAVLSGQIDVPTTPLNPVTLRSPDDE